ncbi:ATP-binding protein [Sulfuritalea sp.]|uniref:ATP-binding response regulator n=1 Tax=Sulfuritalea sp. TaxID=2480090 RepID=UPI00286E35AE|nr:ATP-binding protein [Sulfuritalea sp.]
MSIAFHSAEERAVVKAEQIRAFFSETNDQNLAGALVLSLLVYVVHDGIPAWTWQPALFALYVVTLVRAWLIRQYHRAPASRSSLEWGRSQAISGGLSGVCWGFANTAMLAHLPTELQLLILTVITVAASSNASEGFSYVPPSRAYILASIGPPAIWLLTVGDRLHTILGVMLLVFLPMTIWQARKRNRVFIEAQQLRFRNERLARELTVQRDAAEQAYLAKARFLAAASHDLRQPMQALSIFHELLGQEIQGADPAGKILANAQKAAEGMKTLLDALLDVSRLDANVITPDCRGFPVQALLHQMESEFMPVAGQTGIRLRVRPCSACVTSDPVLLGQVLRNLLSNALRYTPSGRVLLGCRRRNGQLAIEVLDTGIGIAPDQHSAIFAEFYQIGNKARDRSQGLGLGLAIVERVVRLLGHALAMRSEPGRGSCFSVCVPLATPADGRSDAQLPDAEQAQIMGNLAGCRILMVDDEEAIRTGMCELLQGWGCEVTTAGSVAEALDRAAAGPAAIDAVISDMGLPGQGNGIDAIAALRDRYGSQLPALLITGDTSQATLQAAREAQLIMLHKPIKPARLRAALSKVITANLQEDSRAEPPAS